MNADNYRTCLPWCRSHSHGDHGRALSGQDQSFLCHFYKKLIGDQIFGRLFIYIINITCFLPVTDKCQRPPSWRGGQPWWWWPRPGTRQCGRWSLGCLSAHHGQDATRWTLEEARHDIWSARTQSCWRELSWNLPDLCRWRVQLEEELDDNQDFIIFLTATYGFCVCRDEVWFLEMGQILLPCWQRSLWTDTTCLRWDQVPLLPAHQWWPHSSGRQWWVHQTILRTCPSSGWCSGWWVCLHRSWASPSAVWRTCCQSQQSLVHQADWAVLGREK